MFVGSLAVFLFLSYLSVYDCQVTDQVGGVSNLDDNIYHDTRTDDFFPAKLSQLCSPKSASYYQATNGPFKQSFDHPFPGTYK